MKKALLLFIIITSVRLSFAQNAIAKIKYEEAEEAYALNNYDLTLSKLTEVEALLKSTNPKVLYLKICTQSKIIDLDPYNDFALLDNTRKLSDKYLKEYENIPGNDDKYLAVYKVSEKLKDYPLTLLAYEEQIASIKAENIRLEEIRRLEAEQRVREDERKEKAFIVEASKSEKIEPVNPNSVKEFNKTKQAFKEGKISKEEYKLAIKNHKKYINVEFKKIQKSYYSKQITYSEYVTAINTLMEK